VDVGEERKKEGRRSRVVDVGEGRRKEEGRKKE
jgi:hypothetical protein